MVANRKKTGQLPDIVAQEILKLVLNRHLQPGDKLPNETELSDMFGVSRSTLREAIGQLQARHLVEVRQGSGMYVSSHESDPFDPAALAMLYGVDGGADLAMDIIGVRLMLEPQIAAIAASRVTDVQIAELIRLDENVKRTIDSDYSHQEHISAEIAYHGFIAECCGNRILKSLIPVVNNSIHMAVTTWDKSLRESAALQHAHITEAICRHDVLGAQYAMIVHLNNSREFYLAELKKNPQSGIEIL